MKNSAVDLIRLSQGRSRDDLLRLLHREGFSQWEMARLFGAGQRTISGWLMNLGLHGQRDTRSGQNAAYVEVAQADQIALIRLAFNNRRRAKPEPGLTRKQQDVLDILRASPEPLSNVRVSDVAAGLSVTWRDYGAQGLQYVLKDLRRKGRIDRVEVERKRLRDPRFLWFPVQEGQAVESLEDAQLARELARLIEEQRRDDRDRVKQAGTLSLDAGEDGWTLLEQQGADDPALDDFG